MFNKQTWICINNYFRILVDDQEIFRLNTPWNGMYNYCPYHNIEDPWRNGPHNAPFDQPVRLPILWKWHFLQMFFLIIFSYNVSLLRVGIKDRFTTCQIINIMYLRLNPFAKSNHWHLVCSWRRKWRYVWYMKYFVSVCRQIFVISSCSSISFWTWLLVGPGVSSVKDSMMFPSPGVTTPLTQWETSGNTEENGWKPGMGMTLLC